MNKIIKIKRLIITSIVCLIILFSISCSKMNNDIYNKSYDVKINISDISKAFIPAAELASQAVVGVSNYVKELSLSSWNIMATGSGVIYKAKAVLKDGTIKDDITETKTSDQVDYYEYSLITNYHVISSTVKYSKIKVYLSSIDSLIDGELLGYNIIEDLAVIKFKTSVYITPLEFTDSDKVEKGELVLAVGNPEGYEYYSSVTLGIVSYSKRYVSVDRDLNNDGRNDWNGDCEYIQHDASINSGNSGGALVNVQGELLGINAMKLIDKEETIEGMGFAIPSNLVASLLDEMENGINSNTKELNAKLYSVNELRNSDLEKDIPSVAIPENLSYDYGVYVYSMKYSQYGLMEGDYIVSMNDILIYNVPILNVSLRNIEKNDIIWTVFRNGKLIEISYKII